MAQFFRLRRIKLAEAQNFLLRQHEHNHAVLDVVFVALTNRSSIQQPQHVSTNSFEIRPNGFLMIIGFARGRCRRWLAAYDKGRVWRDAKLALYGGGPGSRMPMLVRCTQTQRRLSSFMAGLASRDRGDRS